MLNSFLSFFLFTDISIDYLITFHFLSLLLLILVKFKFLSFLCVLFHCPDVLLSDFTFCFASTSTRPGARQHHSRRTSLIPAPRVGRGGGRRGTAGHRKDTHSNPRWDHKCSKCSSSVTASDEMWWQCVEMEIEMDEMNWVGLVVEWKWR